MERKKRYTDRILRGYNMLTRMLVTVLTAIMGSARILAYCAPRAVEIVRVLPHPVTIYTRGHIKGDT